MEHLRKTLSPEQKAALIAAGEKKRKEREQKKLKASQAQEKELEALRKREIEKQNQALFDKKRALAWAAFYMNECAYQGKHPDKEETAKIKSLLSVSDYNIHRDDYCKIVHQGLGFEGCPIKDIVSKFWREQLEHNIVEPFTAVAALSGGYISAKVCDILIDYVGLFAHKEIGKHIFAKLDEAIKEDGKFNVKTKKFVPLRKDKKDRILKVIAVYLPIYLKRFTDEGHDLREEFADAMTRYTSLADAELKEKISARFHELEQSGKDVPNDLIKLYTA